jgi:hypothetical protein
VDVESIRVADGADGGGAAALVAVEGAGGGVGGEGDGAPAGTAEREQDASVLETMSLDGAITWSARRRRWLEGKEQMYNAHTHVCTSVVDASATSTTHVVALLRRA